MPPNRHPGQDENICADPAVPFNPDFAPWRGCLELDGQLHVLILMAVVSDHDMGSKQDILLQHNLLPCADDIVRPDVNMVSDADHTVLRVRVFGVDKDIRVSADRHFVANADILGPDNMDSRKEINVPAVPLEDHAILQILEVAPDSSSQGD
jgi:hypothetical protein